MNSAKKIVSYSILSWLIFIISVLIGCSLSYENETYNHINSRPVVAPEKIEQQQNSNENNFNSEKYIWENWQY